MNISITQTWPKIGIETQRDSLNMRNNNKIDFKVSHTNPQLDIKTTNPQLHIDQTKAFGDAGRKTNTDLGAEKVQQSEQAVMDFISKKNSEGDRLAKIEQGGKRSLELIREDQIKTYDFNITLMPEHPPEISVAPGELDMNVIEGKVNTEFNDTPVEIEYTPSQVRYSMLQYGSVNIEYIGSKIDTKI